MSNEIAPSSARPVLPRTFLAKVPLALADRVIEGGRRVTLRSGAGLAPSRKPGVAIVTFGLVRIFLASSQRRLTVRYARPGDTLGLAQLFGARLDVRLQALSPSTLWAIPPRKLKELARQSAPLAVAIAEECASLVGDALEELALIAFGSVQQRVARHLLDLADGDAQADGLVAKVTQTQLAEATGSVREVVARALRELQAAGLIEAGHGGVRVLDAAGLDAQARLPPAAGEEVPVRP